MFSLDMYSTGHSYKNESTVLKIRKGNMMSKYLIGLGVVILSSQNLLASESSESESEGERIARKIERYTPDYASHIQQLKDSGLSHKEAVGLVQTEMVTKAEIAKSLISAESSKHIQKEKTKRGKTKAQSSTVTAQYEMYTQGLKTATAGLKTAGKMIDASRPGSNLLQAYQPRNVINDKKMHQIEGTHYPQITYPSDESSSETSSTD